MELDNFYTNNTNLQTENQILKRWNVGYDYVPFVLIRCNVYNHAKYIESAIIGFLSQVTTFPFKIQIHDDASTDGSQEIIKKYYDRYPHIINPILEEENLWSKKDGTLSKAIRANKDGEYIALCEGDDYWIDSRKLEKQITALENNTDCTICYTNAYIENQLNSTIIREEYFHNNLEFYEMTKCDQKLTLDDAYKIPFPPTASFVYRHKLEVKLDELPICQNGDLRLRMCFLALGKAYYLADKTCVYRTNVPYSAMSRWKKDKSSERYKRSVATLTMLNAIDKLTDYKHSAGIFNIKKGHIVSAIKNSKSLKILKQADFRKIFNEYSFLHKIILIIKITFINRFLEKLK